jgi:hypothetical protein
MSRAVPRAHDILGVAPSSPSKPPITKSFIPERTDFARRSSIGVRARRLPMNTTTPRFHRRHPPERRQDHHVARLDRRVAGSLPRIGYIKPVGQRFVEIEEQKIDEDTVLMDAVYRLNCPLVDMSPIAVEPDFTRKYLQSANNEALVKKNPGGL